MRHPEAERANARATLALCGVEVGQNFYTLSNSQVCALLECLRDAQRRINSCLDEIHKLESEKRFRAAGGGETKIIQVER